MSDNFETAGGRFIVGPDGRFARGTFPREWGTPPSDPELRAGWIKARIRCGEIARQYGEDVPWLGRRGGIRTATPRQIAELRLRILDLKQRRLG